MLENKGFYNTIESNYYCLYCILDGLSATKPFYEDLRIGRVKWENTYKQQRDTVDKEIVDKLSKEIKIYKGILKGEDTLYIYEEGKMRETVWKMNRDQLKDHIKEICKEARETKDFFESPEINKYTTHFRKFLQYVVELKVGRIDIENDLVAKVKLLLRRCNTGVYEDLQDNKLEELERCFEKHLEVIKAMKTIRSFKP